MNIIKETLFYFTTYCFVDQCLSFCPFSSDQCMVCPFYSDQCMVCPFSSDQCMVCPFSSDQCMVCPFSSAQCMVCPFSSAQCMVCPFPSDQCMICPVLFMSSSYPFGIFKPFLYRLIVKIYSINYTFFYLSF